MMLKPWLLKLHRWITLAFAAPLAVVILTGLVLSIEPTLTLAASKSSTFTAEKLSEWLAEHDETGAATSLTHRSLAGTLTIGMADDDDDIILDTATGVEQAEEATSTSLMRTARRLHETLLLDLGWVVTASTFAMLALIALGLLMGWPRLRNSISGWHQGMAWFALPLVIISPVTGLMLAYGISFTQPGSSSGAAPMPKIAEAAMLVAASHDLSSLVSLRPRGGRMIARLLVDGEYRSHVVTAQGLAPTQRNWPRLIHEGNWGGHVAAWLNIITSLVMIGLLVTGLTLWLRRSLRRRNAEKAPKAA
jgi:uncharacterized iron-regulated membrane protein